MTKSRSFALTLVGALIISGAACAQSNGRGGDGGGGGSGLGGAEIGANPHVALLTVPGGPNRVPPRVRSRNNTVSNSECYLPRQMGGFSDGGYSDAICRRN